VKYSSKCWISAWRLSSRGPPLVRGPQFENRWSRVYYASVKRHRSSDVNKTLLSRPRPRPRLFSYFCIKISDHSFTVNINNNLNNTKINNDYIHCISLHNFHINDNWQHCNTAWLNRNVKLFLFYQLSENGKVLKILKTFLSRPRPRLYCLSSRRLETKTLVSRTSSLHRSNKL